MESTEIRKLVALENKHWWYRERRNVLARFLRRLNRPPGRALDIGAAGGGNTRVLRDYGWKPIALEYTIEGAQVAKERGLNVIRADARYLPIASETMDLVVAFDILEHIREDYLAAAEINRVLRRSGSVLISVPADPKLWSAHDEAVSHVRRYTRLSLRQLLERAGLVIDELWSWNVRLRPVAAWRRRRASGSDLSNLPQFVNSSLSVIVALERYLPVKRLPGVSLVVRAHKP